MSTNHLHLKERMLPAPRNGGFRIEGYWVWCGSAIKGEDNRYHLFASRWPKTLPMHPGWMFQSEIVRASAPDPCGPYQFEEVVLPARGPAYWDGCSTHNPIITKWDDTYVLYYMGTTYPFESPGPKEPLPPEDVRVQTARSNKRIGMAVSRSIFGPWERKDTPILSTRPACFDNYLVSNPAPCYNPDGSVLLLYKARGYKQPPYTGQLHTDMVFGTAKSSHFSRPFCSVSDIPLFTGQKVILEDPFIWRGADGYEMIAKDMNGNVCGERFGGIHASSLNGIDWSLHMGELAYSRSILWDDGIVEEMGSLERPFLLFEGGIATHAFFATSNGCNNFMDATETWNMVIPLKDPKGL